MFNFSKQTELIRLKSAADIEGMRRAGRLAAATLDYALSLAVPGAMSAEIDRKTAQFMRDHGAKSATLGYKGYPKSTCISVNDVICHGIPGAWKLKAGDIVCVDVTVILDGYYGDTAASIAVGDVKPEARKLMRVTLESLRKGIEAVGPDKRIGDIGHAIQSHVEPLGYGVVQDFVGHGIGKIFHEPPQVPHYGKKGTGTRLKAGMTFTIEPMINLGGWEAKILDDGWTAVTVDGSLSAQFEHTIVVTTEGAEILTLPEGTTEWWAPPAGREI